ncbi:FecCD family ABC transporter permease [Amycolatopsis thermophila]|uniref:Iron complex transport system permease protein n=1 Tax=Amycolatopsis thermophila TaxID=206084 RepID=A0ABU0EV88_9PSEU|nr:iron ABC transporter permease [Amycolatopsis thermophila]MDQ0379230.1 iron complex transport system permease protein [Amycolatopsis thermophila]
MNALLSPTVTRTVARRPLFLVSLLVALVVAVALSLVLGSNDLGLGTAVRVLLHDDGSEAATIVRDVRLPRTTLGVLVGLALGAAGVLMQGHSRNPLADPGLLGINAGAALAVALAAQLFGIADPGSQVWFGFAGALVATAAVFAIGSSGRQLSPVPMALAGAAVMALLSTFTSLIILSSNPTLDVYRRWVVGSISGRDAGISLGILPFVVAGLVLAMINTRALNAVSLGEDTARGLGQSVVASRVVGLAAITLLAGAATAAAGPIASLGLIVPHVVRAVTGPDHRWLMPCSAVAGAVLLLVADVVGRLIAGPAEVPAGIVLAILGGGAFVLIARRTRLVRL